MTVHKLLSFSLFSLAIAACGAPNIQLHDAGPDALASDASASDASASDASTSPDGGPATRTLPAWFEGNRVHAHTRLWLPLFTNWAYDDKVYTDKFATVAPIFDALGVSVYTRHIVSGSEDPWWPSAEPMVNGQSVLQGSGDRTILICDQGSGTETPVVLPANVNLAEQIIDDAHAHGLRIIIYYRHMEDGRVTSPHSCDNPTPLHPEWACHNADGTLAEAGRGVYSDLTTPYREVVLTRLLELAAMGADGFYFDETHMPRNGCWGTALQQSFENHLGIPSGSLSTNLTQDQLNNELEKEYRAFLRYQASEVEETFRYWRNEVKAQYPDVVFVISTTFVPALISQRMTTTLAKISDAPKTEFSLATSDALNLNVFNSSPPLVALEPNRAIRQALGWTLLRDSADGRSPHVWARSRFPTQPHMFGFVTAVLAYGGIANVDINESNIVEANDPCSFTTRAVLAAAYALGEKLSPSLAGTHPVRWAAVHFSEIARNKRQGDRVKVWNEVLWPVTGAFGELVRAHVPVGVVNDDQLQRGQLDGYKLLVLPTPHDLDAQQILSVQQFRANGGIVIENQSTWAWHDPNRYAATAADFGTQLMPHLSNVPITLVDGPPNVHMVAHRHAGTNRLVIALVRDFSWVRSLTSSEINSVCSTCTKEPCNWTLPGPDAPMGNVTILLRDVFNPQNISEQMWDKTLEMETTDEGVEITVLDAKQRAFVVIE